MIDSKELATGQKLHPDTLLESKPCKDLIRPKLIAIGASTGGVDALSVIFSKLPRGLPPIVVVQHIPKTFGSSFAKRLDSLSELDIFEVTQKMCLEQSCAYLASGDSHISLSYENGHYFAKPIDGPRISRHKPSVDILFRNVNNVAGKNALGVILTGMGDDGSIGLKEMYQNGAITIAQDEQSCVVFGMPKKAIEVGGAKYTLSLEQIIEYISNFKG
ncbi:chemotaxis protein CheB [Helicobacter sp. TUL]|uniref:CheB methylesterase domain-containing protein n=1 Tax=Helicobacter sp. TUL TaxID=1848928 RepID=UPI000BABAFC3|nr:CheB methylesterase domain-containing protein [Helicobacter sp. TUL]PAV00774.1 chemotaxis protein CheB [Helicobacter sp. TUL]